MSTDVNGPTAHRQSDAEPAKGMRIARVSATAVNVPIAIELPGISTKTSFSACLCEIETVDGLTGCGFTAITEEEVIAAIINDVAGPEIIGEDALRHERIWDRLYWLLSPRGQTGYAAHAQAAIDIALWDIKGKALGQPVWRLLGGARERVPVYTTFGFAFLDKEQLVGAAKHWVERGFTRLKMTVGHQAQQNRDRSRSPAEIIREDARRVLAVREAVGEEVAIFIDANCSLDHYHAMKLAQAIAPAKIAFFEEPLVENDVRLLADLRRQTGVAIAAGQNEGLAYRFRDLMIHGAVDVLQPNVAIGGGFTQCVRIAGMAAAFNVPIANGGAWTFHNMHFHAGLAHGGLVEYHYPAVLLSQQIFRNLPEAEQGWLTLPETPGLGFEPDHDAIRELAAKPASRGKGKG